MDCGLVVVLSEERESGLYGGCLFVIEFRLCIWLLVSAELRLLLLFESLLYLLCNLLLLLTRWSVRTIDNGHLTLNWCWLWLLWCLGNDLLLLLLLWLLWCLDDDLLFLLLLLLLLLLLSWFFVGFTVVGGLLLSCWSLNVR